MIKLRKIHRPRWPFMKRSTHNKILMDKQKYWDVWRDGMSRDIEHAQEKSDRLLGELMRIKVVREPGFGEYRLVLDFDNMLMRGMNLEWGNDHQFISYACERIAHDVERELKTINFSRIPISGTVGSSE